MQVSLPSTLPNEKSWGKCHDFCAAVASVHAFTARNIANALWALAKMMHNPGDRFLNTMGAEVAKKVVDFNAQNHANTVWAFATLGMWPASIPAVVGTKSRSSSTSLSDTLVHVMAMSV